MNAIGEVEGGGSARQLFDLALGGKNINLVLEDIGLQGINEFLSAASNVLLPVHELTQPGDFGVELLVLTHAFLVAPVRRHPVLGYLVHLMGADLDFEWSPVDGQNGGVK